MTAPSKQISRRTRARKQSLSQAAWTDSTWLLVVQTATLLAITAAVLTRYWSDHVWFGWLLIAIATVVWAPELSRPRLRRWWFVYVVGIFAYTILRSYADETAIPVRTDYVITFDRWLPGPSPVPSLQQEFFDRHAVDWLDYFMVAVHWSFFLAPHAAAVLVFLFRPRLFPKFALLMVGIMYAGLALFVLVPTTPPWLAAQHGDLPGAYRVMDFVGGKVSGDSYESFYASLAEPNSVAAMPSIHMAVTFALFLWAAEYNRRAWAVALLAYSAVMGIALVYLAEHYVADELVGILCAVLVYGLLTRTGEFRVSGSQPIEAGSRGSQTKLAGAHDHLTAPHE